MRWAIAAGVYLATCAWLWRSAIQGAADARNWTASCCAWCGEYTAEHDKWLAKNGATVSHGMCAACRVNFEGGE